MGGSLTIICNYFRKECIMPRKRNSLKHDLFIAASKISQTIERGQAIKEQLLDSQSGLKNTILRNFRYYRRSDSIISTRSKR